jgi:hypothetical protein
LRLLEVISDQKIIERGLAPTSAALGLTDRGDIANELIAKRIIELAKAGERHPDLLCEERSERISPAVANVG